MASKNIPTGTNDGKGKGPTLVAALEWRVLAGSGDAGLRDMAKERAATHAAVIKIKPSEASTKKGKSKNREVAGFFVSADGSSPMGKSFSVAALFSAWMQEHKKALLCYNLEPDSSGWLVVVALDGMPVVDALVPNWEEANELLANYLASSDDVSIVSNDPVKYPTTIKADNILPALLHFATNNKDVGRIKSIPADLKKMFVVLLLVAISTYGYFYYQGIEKEKEKRILMAETIQNDPSNLYNNALAAQGATLGKTRESLINAFQSALSLPIRMGGWNLKSITCQDTCTAHYDRATGTIETLNAALKRLGEGFTLIPPVAGLADLDKASVTVPAQLQVAGISPNAPTHDAFLQGPAATRLQNWKTAGLSVQISAPALWPQVAGVPSTFKGPTAIALGKVDVNGVALPLVKEVLSTAPSNIIWQGIAIDISDTKIGNNPLENTSVRLNGVFYVTN